LVLVAEAKHVVKAFHPVDDTTHNSFLTKCCGANLCGAELLRTLTDEVYT